MNTPPVRLTQHLYRELRGSNHLVSPNSRKDVEYYADGLRRRCEQDNAPNEFWAHHGNLSRQYREDAEQALKSGAHAATAICTTTLDLGIDIGNVKSVAQIYFRVRERILDASFNLRRDRWFVQVMMMRYGLIQPSSVSSFLMSPTARPARWKLVHSLVEESAQGLLE